MGDRLHAIFWYETNQLYIIQGDSNNPNTETNFYVYENDKWFFCAVNLDYESIFTSEIYSY